MQGDQLLEQRLRRSSSGHEEDLFQDFMDYALTVSDEMEVYLYMQDHQIGTDHARYWIARMEVLRREGKFVAAVAMLNSLKQQPHLQAHYEIERYEQRLLQHLRAILLSKATGKRRALQFSTAIEGVLKQRRKIGNIEVYVDPVCRRNYELQDLAEHVEERLKDYCQVEREDYRRQQMRKPPSFIAKKERRLMELAHEVLDKAARKSEHRRNSLAPGRQSIRPGKEAGGRFEAEGFNTPKGGQQAQGHAAAVAVAGSKEELQKKRKKDSGRDSIQILRSMRKGRKDEILEYTSPKFASQGDLPPHQMPPAVELPPVERCRSMPASDEVFSFSFGKAQKEPESQRKIFQRELENRDNAFMFHSFSQDSRGFEKQGLVKKEDFELQLIIKEIQRENYEKMQSRTFSSVDSNQENEGFFQDRPQTSHGRKPFEVLLQAQAQRFPARESICLQDLVDFDDDLRNPEEVTFSQQGFLSNYKRRPFGQFGEFRSETKAMSSIREENSHFYSESKKKHSRGK